MGTFHKAMKLVAPLICLAAYAKAGIVDHIVEQVYSESNNGRTHTFDFGHCFSMVATDNHDQTWSVTGSYNDFCQPAQNNFEVEGKEQNGAYEITGQHSGSAENTFHRDILPFDEFEVNSMVKWSQRGLEWDWNGNFDDTEFSDVGTIALTQMTMGDQPSVTLNIAGAFKFGDLFDHEYDLNLRSIAK